MAPLPPPLPAHVQHGSIASTLRAGAPTDGWRCAAVALLRLSPSECEALGEVFEDGSSSDELRQTVLDLLAAAGTFEAQVVMRRLLALAVARKSSRTFASFVQRLGFCECPDGPTLRFLMSVYAESRAEAAHVRAACAYALGAAAGHATVLGDVDAALRATELLRRDLLTAKAADAKCALVTALGNAGLGSDAPLLVRVGHDADPLVRSAAALALRKFSSPEVKARLVAMLNDRELRVAESALISLSEHPLTDDDLARIADLVVSGRIAPKLDERLLRVFSAHRSIARGPRSSVVENAVRLMLGRIETARTGSGEWLAVRLEEIGLDPNASPAPPPPASRQTGIRPIAPPEAVLDDRAHGPLSMPRPPEDLARTVAFAISPLAIGRSKIIVGS